MSSAKVCVRCTMHNCTSYAHDSILLSYNLQSNDSCRFFLALCFSLNLWTYSATHFYSIYCGINQFAIFVWLRFCSCFLCKISLISQNEWMRATPLNLCHANHGAHVHRKWLNQTWTTWVCKMLFYSLYSVFLPVLYALCVCRVWFFIASELRTNL